MLRGQKTLWKYNYTRTSLTTCALHVSHILPPAPPSSRRSLTRDTPHGPTAPAGELGPQRSSGCRFPSPEGAAYESESSTGESLSYRADGTPERVK